VQPPEIALLTAPIIIENLYKKIRFSMPAHAYRMWLCGCARTAGKIYLAVFGTAVYKCPLEYKYSNAGHSSEAAG
jgi:hypothetical protein